MKIKPLAIGLTLLFGSSWFGSATTAELTTFQDLSTHYEAIRIALLNDTMEDVAQHAEAIAQRAQQLAEDFDNKKAGVPEDKSAECEELLPELAASAKQLNSAEDLAQAREAFFELSKPMGRFRKMAGIEGTTVVFCPMAKKAWIQPEGEIGNPYLGQEMPTCGEVVPD